MGVIKDDPSYRNGLTPPEPPEDGEPVEQHMVGSHEDGLGVPKGRRKTMSGSIRLSWNTEFGRLFHHLANELPGGRKIDERLLEFPANRLTDEKSHQRLAATSVQLDDQITFLAALVPRTKSGCLRVPQVVHMLRLRKGLEDPDGIHDGIARRRAAQSPKINHCGR